MHNGKILPVLILAGIILSSIACGKGAIAQKDSQEINSFPALSQLFANQPDHMADWVVVIDDQFIGGKLIRTVKVARKQGKSRVELHPFENEEKLKPGIAESYKLFVLGQPGQPRLAFNPQEKTYTEAPENFKAAPFDPDSFVKNAPAGVGAPKVENMGTVSRDGHEAIKVRLTFKSEKEGINFYFAKNLNNLFIGMGGDNPQDQSSFKVTNISFDVPDTLFEMPEGYKKVDWESFQGALAKAERSIGSKTPRNRAKM